jgi:biopolymer transport protein ExbB
MQQVVWGSVVLKERVRSRCWRQRVTCLLVGLAIIVLGCGVTQAQQATPDPPEVADVEALERLKGENAGGQPAAPDLSVESARGLDLLTLLQRGGWFMLPIGLTSLVVVAIAIERSISLRRSKVVPRGLSRGLRDMARDPEGWNPREAYRITQQFPSAGSEVVQTVLEKIGRPQTEVDQAARDAMQRHADRLYAPVRWLNLAAGIAPLFGLMGTVWGLIHAFHHTTQLDSTQNRAEFLAQGIYEALVTTLAGLMVAIPAAILSHLFEGKISAAFRQLEELISTISLKIERFEGRTRYEIAGEELVARDLGEQVRAYQESNEAVEDSGTAKVLSASSAVVRRVPSGG